MRVATSLEPGSKALISLIVAGLTLGFLAPLSASAAMATTAKACSQRPDTQAAPVKLPGGRFILGSDKGYADEGPPVEVQVEAFQIDRTEVTNSQFAAFVKATGYVTDAERSGEAAVFVPPTPEALYSRPLAWWQLVKGANWRHPSGPGSDIRDKPHHPVVQVTQADALAYARWRGRDLPTEAQWEFAARSAPAPGENKGGPRDAQGRPTANYWQGNFPLLNTREDGHEGLAPAGCYAPNPQGLYDMIGNAWEWTRDAHTGPRQSHANGDPALLRQSSGQTPAKAVIKGGSFLCAPDYCVRYRAAAREAQEKDLPTSHVGFRTVSRGPSP
jgi:formylglycine-generating enzyme